MMQSSPTGRGKTPRPLRAFRDRARTAFFAVIHRAAATDDAKRAATDMLRGLLAWRPEVPWRDCQELSALYPEMSRQVVTPPARQTAPIFITGRFRSGSTLVWNLMRHLEACTTYYEPFNENVWAAARLPVDPTHRRVSNYWSEYEGVRDLASRFQPAWTFDHLYMEPGFWNPEMRDYIAALVERSPRRAVLKFNRIDFRLPWFRRHFPEARIVHVYRHPRDQWCSMLRDITAFPAGADASQFPIHDLYYLLAWSRDLRYHFPFLSKGTTHPYRLSYYLWKLSYMFGVAYADHSVAFEQLTGNPVDEVRALMEAVGIERYDMDRLMPLIAAPPRDRWKAYADEEWFARHESACEEVLAQFRFGSL